MRNGGPDRYFGASLHTRVALQKSPSNGTIIQYIGRCDKTEIASVICELSNDDLRHHSVLELIQNNVNG